MSNRAFSARFGDAWDGLVDAVRTQGSMRIHVAASVVALIAGAFFHVGVRGFIYLAFAISFVLACEIINTAVETTVDILVREFHPGARRAKHLAAGAVLVASVNAIVVGFVVFYGPLTRMLSGLLGP